MYIKYRHDTDSQPPENIMPLHTKWPPRKSYKTNNHCDSNVQQWQRLHTYCTLTVFTDTGSQWMKYSSSSHISLWGWRTETWANTFTPLQSVGSSSPGPTSSTRCSEQWPSGCHGEEVKANLPEEFKKLTRHEVIVDSTALLLQSETFSNSKSHCTMKALVGLALHGQSPLGPHCCAISCLLQRRGKRSEIWLLIVYIDADEFICCTDIDMTFWFNYLWYWIWHVILNLDYHWITIYQLWINMSA